MLLFMAWSLDVPNFRRWVFAQAFEHSLAEDIQMVESMVDVGSWDLAAGIKLPFH